MKKIYITNLFLFLAFGLFGQKASNIVSGLVVDQDQTPLIGATLVWEGTTEGTVTNGDGYFQINRVDNSSSLIVTYVGFEPDTVAVDVETSEIIVFLALGVDLGEIVITDKLRDHYASAIKTFNVETIGSGELRKAACCNLSESFETNGAVNVSYSDAVTGAKEIEMLGLRGVYSQMMIENRPSMRGLGYTFGMEYVPGTWVSNISIAKGASTVVNGYEGITGIINVELIKPFEGEKIHVNGYGNHVGRSELNVHLNHKIKEKWSVGTLLHGSYFTGEVDHGNDKFMDIPKKQTLNGLARLFYRGEKIRGQFNVQALTHRLQGGQIGYEDNPIDLYGFELTTNRIEVFSKLGYIGFANPFASVGWITNVTYHQNDGFFGRKAYDATQKSLYTNLMYQNIIQTSENTYKAGISYQLDDYDEIFNGADYSLMESVIGGYFEYAYNRPKISDKQNSFGFIGGLRADYHNLYGWFITPRMNIKYNFDDNTVVRLSGGRGYRTARILSENISALTSARTINLTEALQPEEAWNVGINFTRNTTFLGKDISFSADLYTTQFVNQIVMDRETEADEILFYNLKGKSYSNSFLTTIVYDLYDFLEVKLAYKYNDVKIDYNGNLLQVPLVAKHRGLITLGYTSKDETWKIHTTTQIVGPQRLPTLQGHEDHSAAGHGSLTDYQLTGISPTFLTQNAQVTKILGKWEIYIGGENLTNYQQHHPIIGARDPFNQDIGIPVFDASQIYAPIMGTMIYGGFRFTIE